MGTEDDHLRSVEHRLAHCRDELKRVRLELAKAKGNAQDALYCLNHDDEAGARYNLLVILGEEEEEGA